MKVNQTSHNKRTFYRLYIYFAMRLTAVIRVKEKIIPVFLKSTFHCILRFFVHHVFMQLVHICLLVLKITVLLDTTYMYIG